MSEIGLQNICAEKITTLQQEWTCAWHVAPGFSQMESPWQQIELNHWMNFSVWHEEDIARRDDLGPQRVRDAKRAIDRFNQARNDAIEQMDIWIAARLPAASDETPLHSETPGMMIDRLSILSLKQYHMEEEALRETATEPHRQECRLKLERIRSQRNDLADCLENLLQLLALGERAFKLYKQFKMYNDPALNPQLYLNRSQ